MRVIRSWGVCVLVALAIGGISASSAFAAHELPEWGRCVKSATPGSGEFTSAACLTKAVPGKGKYDWVAAAVTEKLTFTGSSGEVTLKTPGHTTISCATANIAGEYTGAKTASVTIELQGCLDQGGKQCQSTGGVLSQIKTLPLEAVLGYTRNEEVNGKLVVAPGLDLKPTPPLTALAIYECTGSGETATLERGVIGKLKPFNKMTLATNLALFVRKTGQQVPESFAGGPKETLATSYTKGLETTGPFDSTLNLLEETGTNSVPFEIKVKEK